MPTRTTSGVTTDATDSSVTSVTEEPQSNTSVTNTSVTNTSVTNKVPVRTNPPPAPNLQRTEPIESSYSTRRGARPAKDSLREQKKAKARELILDCAQQLISTDGYAETKMRDVASAANMSYQTLYNYFPTKGLILQELLTRNLVKLRRGAFDAQQGGEPISTRLREFAKGYIDAIAPDERHLWKEVCAELLKVTAHHSCLLAMLDEQALSKLRNLIANAQAVDELAPHIDIDTFAEVLYSLLDAMLMRYLLDESLSRPNILSAISAQIRFIIAPYLR